MQEDFDPDYFNSLPLELQRQIITERSDLTLAFSGVNADYNELLERPIYNLCDKPISDHELLHIIDYQPTRGNLHKKYLKYNKNGIGQVGNLLVLISEHPILGHHTIMIEVIVDHRVKIQEIPLGLHDQKLAFYKTSNHDFLTLHNVWSNRLSCMKMNPAYAKEKVLKRFDEQQQLYENFMAKDRRIDFSYQNMIITVYCVLIVHKYVFNIIDKSKLTKLNDIYANIKEIKEDIDYLHTAIRQKLVDYGMD